MPPWYMRILLGCFIFGIIGIFTVVGVMTPRRWAGSSTCS